jgi:hypothetical protein
MSNKELVERLRREVFYTSGGERADCTESAADAIEALEAKAEKYRADYENMKAHNLELFGMVSALEAENARLREALGMIAGTVRCPDNLLGNSDIARKALEPKQ